MAISPLIALCTLSAEDRAPTNRFASTINNITYYLTPASDGSLFQEYRFYFTNRLSEAATRNFRPMRTLEWQLNKSASPAYLNEKLSEAVLDTIQDGLESAGEEVLYNTSLKLWADEFGQSLLERVLGNTDERFISLNEPQSFSEHWWQHAGIFDYGFRPQLEPYVFITFAPEDEFDTLLFRFHSRIYLRDYTSFSVETLFFLPLFEGWQFGVWHTFRPTEYGNTAMNESAATLALQKEYRPGREFVLRFGHSNLNGNFLFVGFSSYW